MAMAKRYLKEDGRMIFAVPLGRDCVVWNAHRIYGVRRFPLLMKNWNILDSFGFDAKEFKGILGNYGYQPVFYLSPKL